MLALGDLYSGEPQQCKGREPIDCRSIRNTTTGNPTAACAAGTTGTAGATKSPAGTTGTTKSAANPGDSGAKHKAAKCTAAGGSTASATQFPDKATACGTAQSSTTAGEASSDATGSAHARATACGSQSIHPRTLRHWKNHSGKRLSFRITSSRHRRQERS